MPPRTAPEVEQLVLEAYAAGEHVNCIAGKLGIGVGTVYAVLARHQRAPDRAEPWRHDTSYRPEGSPG